MHGDELGGAAVSDVEEAAGAGIGTLGGADYKKIRQQEAGAEKCIGRAREFYQWTSLSRISIILSISKLAQFSNSEVIVVSLARQRPPALQAQHLVCEKNVGHNSKVKKCASNLSNAED